MMLHQELERARLRRNRGGAFINISQGYDLRLKGDPMLVCAAQVWGALP